MRSPFWSGADSADCGRVEDTPWTWAIPHTSRNRDQSGMAGYRAEDHNHDGFEGHQEGERARGSGKRGNDNDIDFSARKLNNWKGRAYFENGQIARENSDWRDVLQGDRQDREVSGATAPAVGAVRPEGQEEETSADIIAPTRIHRRRQHQLPQQEPDFSVSTSHTALIRPILPACRHRLSPLQFLFVPGVFISRFWTAFRNDGRRTARMDATLSRGRRRVKMRQHHFARRFQRKT
jgi:hypothetical protein